MARGEEIDIDMFETVAYIAIGVSRKFTAIGDDAYDAIVSKWEGESNVIRHIVSFVYVIEEMWTQRQKDWNGHFLYEVAEPFGQACAQVLADGNALTLQVAEELGEELFT